MENEAGNQVDTTAGAGTAGHGAGAPESQPPPAAATPPAPAAATPPAPAAAAPAAPAAAPVATPPAAPAQQSVDDMLRNPAVQAEIRKQATLAAKKAQTDAAEEARITAERAKMDEVQRLKAEKADAEAKNQVLQARADAAERERDLGTVLVTRKVQLQDDAALAFVRHQAFAKVDADASLTMDAAVQAVLGEHAYLIRPMTAPAPGGAPDPVAAPAQRPSTAPSAKATQTPAAPTPTKGVDVTQMTRAEYEDYKRATHSIH